MGENIIAGRYEITSRLGRGGMAAVYRATDQRLLRDVAIKILPEDEEGQSHFYFHREARAIAAFTHPNIVQIHDYSGAGEKPAFIVMELIEGGNAEERLLSRHPVPEGVIVAVIYGVASALAHAHEKGVIHRDIKPANVMLEDSGRVLLTDFGVAKAYRDKSLLGHTTAGQQTSLFGTPEFMTPEQVLNEPIGPHTDVFSLGTLIYALAANGSPFLGADTVETLRAIVKVAYPPLKTKRPELSDKLCRMVDVCLQAEPSLRPTAQTVALHCEHLLLHQHQIGNPQRYLHTFLSGKAPQTLPDSLSQHASVSQLETIDDGVTEVDRPNLAAMRDDSVSTPGPGDSEEIGETLHDGNDPLRHRTITPPPAPETDEFGLDTEPGEMAATLIMDRREPQRNKLIVGLVAVVVALAIGLGVFLVARPLLAPATSLEKEASIEATIRPTDATIQLDGRELGPAGDLKVMVVEPGWHKVVATHPELGSREENILVNANRRHRLSIDLRKKPLDLPQPKEAPNR